MRRTEAITRCIQELLISAKDEKVRRLIERWVDHTPVRLVHPLLGEDREGGDGHGAALPRGQRTGRVNYMDDGR